MSHNYSRSYDTASGPDYYSMNDMNRPPQNGGASGYPTNMQGFKSTSQPWYKTPWVKIGVPVLLVVGELQSQCLSTLDLACVACLSEGIL